VWRDHLHGILNSIPRTEYNIKDLNELYFDRLTSGFLILTMIDLHGDRESCRHEDVVEGVRVADDGVIVYAIVLDGAKVRLMVLHVLEADAPIRSFVRETHVIAGLDADLFAVR
jgi:hypothetical protein